MENVVPDLEVGLSNDNCQVVINFRNSKPNARGLRQIKLIPRKARYLANLLIDYATEAEETCKEGPANAFGG